METMKKMYVLTIVYVGICHAHCHKGWPVAAHKDVFSCGVELTVQKTQYLLYERDDASGHNHRLSHFPLKRTWQKKLYQGSFS